MPSPPIIVVFPSHTLSSPHTACTHCYCIFALFFDTDCVASPFDRAAIGSERGGGAVHSASSANNSPLLRATSAAASTGPGTLRHYDDVPFLGATASGLVFPGAHSAEPSPMAKRRVSTGDECVFCGPVRCLFGGSDGAGYSNTRYDRDYLSLCLQLPMSLHVGFFLLFVNRHVELFVFSCFLSRHACSVVLLDFCVFIFHCASFQSPFVVISTSMLCRRFSRYRVCIGASRRCCTYTALCVVSCLLKRGFIYRTGVCHLFILLALIALCACVFFTL